MPPPTPTEIDALLDARPPISPGNTLVTWLSAWANAFVLIAVGLGGSLATRRMPLGPRLGILIGTGVVGLFVAYYINRRVENWEAHRIGLVARWVDWWRRVNEARQALLDAGLPTEVLPTLERLPAAPRRWLRRAATR